MSCRTPKHASHTSTFQRKTYKHPCVYTALKGSLIGALITVGIASSTPAFAQDANVPETGTQGAAASKAPAQVEHAVHSADTVQKAGTSGAKAPGNGAAGAGNADDTAVKTVKTAKSDKATKSAEQASTKGAVASGTSTTSTMGGKDAKADENKSAAQERADTSAPEKDPKNSIATATSLTKDKAAALPGCEVIDVENDYNHVIIRPKEGKEKGVISQDLNDDKKTDWTALKEKIRNADTIEFQGTIYGYGSLSGMFEKSYVRTFKNINTFDVSNVTDMSYMFYHTDNIPNFDGLSTWNTSKVTNMRYMFGGLEGTSKRSGNLSDSLKSIANWDTHNVKDMSDMFQGCNELYDLNFLSKWNTSQVTDMHEMFYSCKSLLNIDGVANWKTGNVKDMSGMFRDSLHTYNNSGSDIFSHSTKPKITSNLDALKNWSVSKVSTFRDMFAGCDTIEDVSALSKWHFADDASKVPLINLNNMLPDPDTKTPTKFLASLLTNLKKYNGSVDLTGWNLTQLNEQQVKDIFGEAAPFLIYFDKNQEHNSADVDPTSPNPPAIYNIKSAKKITLSFSNPAEHKIEFGDFPAVCVMDSTFYSGYGDSLEVCTEGIQQELNKLIEKKIQELKKKYPEITGEYTPTRLILSPEDLFQTYKLAVNMPPRSVWVKPTKVGNPLQKQLAPAHAKLTPAAHMKLAPAQVKPQAAPHGKRVLAQTSDLMWTTSFACLGLMCGFIASAGGTIAKKLTRARAK